VTNSYWASGRRCYYSSPDLVILEPESSSRSHLVNRDELRPLRASVVSHQHSAGSQGPGSSCMHAALDKGPGQGPYAAIV